MVKTSVSHMQDLCLKTSSYTHKMKSAVEEINKSMCIDRTTIEFYTRLHNEHIFIGNLSSTKLEQSPKGGHARGTY